MNLEIISDTKNQSGISIGESDEFGYSLFNGDEEITGESDFRKPIHLSYLKMKMQQRSWNIPLRHHITVDRNLAVRIENSTDYIDNVDETKGLIISNNRGIDSTEVKNRLNDIIVEMEKNNIYLYDTSHSIVDLLKNTVTYNILNYSSDVYTNTLSLNQLHYDLAYPNCRGQVELSVQYSKNNRVYNHDIIFEITSGRKNNFKKEINKDVVVEYIDNIISVISISNEVDECIISNCTLTYGNI